MEGASVRQVLRHPPLDVLVHHAQDRTYVAAPKRLVNATDDVYG
jgi:hypothetical protein